MYPKLQITAGKCLTHSNEISFKPGFVLDSIEAGELTPRHINHTVMHIWVLGGGVVAPDDHILNMGGRNTTTHRHLQEGDKARRLGANN